MVELDSLRRQSCLNSDTSSTTTIQDKAHLDEKHRPIFRPITATQNGRYEVDAVVCPKAMIIPAGRPTSNAADMLSPVPDGWTEHVHPEGAAYFFNLKSRFITDVYIKDPQLLGELLPHLEVLSKDTVGIITDDIEIFVQLDRHDEVCKYYIVDHGLRTIFWLEEKLSDALDMPDSTSMTQMNNVLLENYWTHVEYFPHRLPQPEAARELLDILTYGRGDHLTSDNSAFPYDAKQCGNFIDIIRNSNIASVEVNWFIARLWTSIARHRFDTYYGEAHAKISRDQRRLQPRKMRRSFLSDVISRTLFGMPDVICRDFDRLFVDNMVYTMHWRKFIQAHISEWQQISCGSFVVLLVNSTGSLFAREYLSRSAGLVAAVLSAGSLISSLSLLHMHSGARNFHASDAAQYARRNDHATHGFRAISTAFSLPKGLAIWSLVGLSVQILLMISELDAIVPIIVVGAFASLVMLALLLTLLAVAWRPRSSITSEPRVRWWSKIRMKCRRTRTTVDSTLP